MKKYKVKYRRVGRIMDIFEVTIMAESEEQAKMKVYKHEGFNVVSAREIKK